MTGQAIVSRLKNISAIEGADKIVQAKIFGETVIISKDHEEGEVGILFDIETELSHEFCHYNNLYRHSELNADKTASGYIEDNRRVKPIRLKGVQCSGFWMPIQSISFANKQGKIYGEGHQFNEINGIEICKKYVPKHNHREGTPKNKEGKVSLKSLVPTFKEHIDTDHFMRNQQKIDDGDLVIVTEKLHGTSGRAGFLPVNLSGWKIKILQALAKVFGYAWFPYRHQFVVGSRRVVKSIDGNKREESKHWYDEDLWTKIATEHFGGKLEKGETVYFEIVGYTPNGQPIMGSHDNKKLKPFMDKKDYNAFISRYGDKTEFSYGCSVHPDKLRPEIDSSKGGFYTEKDFIKTDQYKVFVYRITRTNGDGESIDLSWEQLKRRCEVLGVKHVPELHKFMAERDDRDVIMQPSGMKFEDFVETVASSNTTNFPDHIREGVCIRVENGGLTPIILKHKAYLFRVLEGQIKEPSLEDNN